MNKYQKEKNKKTKEFIKFYNVLHERKDFYKIRRALSLCETRKDKPNSHKYHILKQLKIGMTKDKNVDNVEE